MVVMVESDEIGIELPGMVGITSPEQAQDTRNRNTQTICIFSPVKGYLNIQGFQVFVKSGKCLINNNLQELPSVYQLQLMLRTHLA